MPIPSRPVHSGLLVLVALACLGAQPPAVVAQSAHPVAVGGTYTYVHTNILPGCNCVSLNGGSAEMQYGLGPHWAGVVDFTAANRSGITPDGYSLTQLSYTAGARYWVNAPGARLRPFAEVTAGGAHALGSLSPANSGVGGSSNAFAMQAGGGLQVNLGTRFILQPVEAEYLLTTFNNTGSNRQNDLRVSAGVLFRLSR